MTKDTLDQIVNMRSVTLHMTAVGTAKKSKATGMVSVDGLSSANAYAKLVGQDPSASGRSVPMQQIALLMAPPPATSLAWEIGTSHATATALCMMMAVDGLVTSVNWRSVPAKTTALATEKPRAPGQDVSASVPQNGSDQNAKRNCAKPRIVTIREWHLVPVQTSALANV